ncbi:phosphotransferase [Plantactinospora sp. WMMB334]|uniref:phosphotransferase n=1 Tax=Plantactinospora sp. WMMB334 TaxID=3404119 RepID=UPI003B92359A
MRSTDAGAGDTTMNQSTLRQVVDAFRLGPVTRTSVVTEGLDEPQLARHHHDRHLGGQAGPRRRRHCGPPTAPRHHRATTALAGLGLPVPAPLVVILDAAVYTVVPWATGAHRHGLTLTRAEAATLGTPLGRLHVGLGEVMPPVPDHLAAVPTDPSTAHAKIDQYLDVTARRRDRDDFDRYAQTQLHQRRQLVEQAAGQRPATGMPVRPCGYTHGDYQHTNQLWDQGGVSAVLDWDRLGVRTLGQEVVRSATLLFSYGDERGLDLARVTAFSAGYRQQRPIRRHRPGRRGPPAVVGARKVGEFPSEIATRPLGGASGSLVAAGR